VDPVDARIMEELRRHGRTPATVLSRRLQISRHTVESRLRRLQQSGVIRYFGVAVDHQRLGKGMIAFSLVKVGSASKDFGRVGRMLARLPEIVEVHSVVGRLDYIVKLQLTNLKEFSEILVRMRTIPGVSGTETFLLIDSLKEDL
jgi:Lrp/AsnC family transcriptional regulator, leucine-responsive regulatory protein